MIDKIETTPLSMSDKIAREIYCKIASGECKRGEKLPSVREMAAKWSVSPDTVQRAYSQLEQLSLSEAVHGMGTFVTEDESRIVNFRRDLMRQKVDTFVGEMRDIGVSVPEIVSALEREGKSSIVSADDAKKFLADFERHASLDENGNYALTFRNETDYSREEVWTTLFKSGDKWYFRSQGKTWAGFRAKEIPDATLFVLKYAKSIPLSPESGG